MTSRSVDHQVNLPVLVERTLPFNLSARGVPFPVRTFTSLPSPRSGAVTPAHPHASGLVSWRFPTVFLWAFVQHVFLLEALWTALFLL